MKPDLKVLQHSVNKALRQYSTTEGGSNASYIPYLASVPSTLVGLAIVTTEGDIIAAGDTGYRFAIESISKICTLALALEDVGPKMVQEKVGVTPTDLPLNSVIALELHQGKPLSPLVNAGAMTTVSLIQANDRVTRWRNILQIQQQLSGAPISSSDEVNQSAQTANFHNRAMAWLLYSAGVLYCDPMEACEVYTRQCSTLLNTIELATIGATFAAAGINPISKLRVLTASHIPFILAEMSMEGLYGSSGDWAYNVGLPGKSGVGGGVLAVVPGVMAIAGFSPPLDPIGNSVRGQKMVAHVAKSLGYNLYKM
ncbi:glutaminase A [Yersinia mollaretii]|uniref:Glutaminase n=1 Tax=Yersinia mollaretii TaxID=33060 RepID=A0AA44I0M1_YERMO|nr:glutaminase A [Yersinia mollaretii]NIL23595.1 glutaminase A [Yersinia mollaretii]CNI31542.1 glutaminase [Yersinia mollaretii]CQQ55076.1 glutaminase [Yersinia mollaretii]